MIEYVTLALVSGLAIDRILDHLRRKRTMSDSPGLQALNKALAVAAALDAAAGPIIAAIQAKQGDSDDAVAQGAAALEGSNQTLSKVLVAVSPLALPATIPAATAGTTYDETITPTGGVGTVAVGVTGTLPGLTINGANISGTPTASTPPVPYVITATAKDEADPPQSVTVEYTLTY